jgi:hypothetical protein
MMLVAVEYVRLSVFDAKKTLSETTRNVREGLGGEDGNNILASLQKKVDNASSEFVEMVNNFKERYKGGVPKFIDHGRYIVQAHK